MEHIVPDLDSERSQLTLGVRLWPVLAPPMPHDIWEEDFCEMLH